MIRNQQNALYVQKAELRNVTKKGKYSYHWAVTVKHYRILYLTARCSRNCHSTVWCNIAHLSAIRRIALNSLYPYDLLGGHAVA